MVLANLRLRFLGAYPCEETKMQPVCTPTDEVLACCRVIIRDLRTAWFRLSADPGSSSSGIVSYGSGDDWRKNIGQQFIDLSCLLECSLNRVPEYGDGFLCSKGVLAVMYALAWMLRDIGNERSKRSCPLTEKEDKFLRSISDTLRAVIYRSKNQERIAHREPLRLAA